MTKRAGDIEAVFCLLAGARSSPVSSGYRPQHQIHENYFASGEHDYFDRTLVAPGETARVEIRFISPEAYPRCLWVGRKLAVYEGSHQIGEIEVIAVRNPLLFVSPLEFKTRWEESDALQRS